MGNELTVYEKLNNFIESRADKFNELNCGALNPLSFEREAVFARQAVLANDYLCQTAQQNNQSLADAIYNVASIGISLNPAYSHAYLVPRKVGDTRKVCLDISYRGLIKLATDTGVIEYMKAEIVYSNDVFEYHGFDIRPTITANPFKDRGDVIGCVAWAKLTSGSYLVELMDVNELHGIRDDSEAYKSAVSKGENSWNYINCVWVKYYGEMIKKTVIKRLAKTLPQSKGGNSRVIEDAVAVINEHEGINFEQEPIKIHYTQDVSDAYKLALDEADYVGLLCIHETLSGEAMAQLWKLHEEPRIEKGGKGKYNALIKSNLEAAESFRDDKLNTLLEEIHNGDEMAVAEIWNECNQWEKDYYSRKWSEEQDHFIRSIGA